MDYENKLPTRRRRLEAMALLQQHAQLRNVQHEHNSNHPWQGMTEIKSVTAAATLCGPPTDLVSGS